MRLARVAVALISTLGLVGMSGCGGGGHGFNVPSDPIKITSNALPNTLSGQAVDFCIPFTGGRGGPYVLEVIAGSLPDGVVTDNQTVCLKGRALEDGTFDFVLKLTDAGSDPFGTTTMSYHWVVGVGTLVFATDAILPTYVYNRFDSVPLVVAGGVPPYTCQVVDDPNNPNDELLPTGLSIPPDSTTILGAPTGVKATPPPFVFKVSIQARDHADIPDYPFPATVIKEFTIIILVPPLVIVTTSVANGKCGQTYNDKIEIADGIPPFTHNVVGSVGSNVALLGEPGTPGGVAKGSAGSAYEAANIAGPYNARFPEGIYIKNATGDLTGIPRRSGAFNSWIYHVNSNVLPAEASQNGWKAYTFSMADSVPPNVSLDTSVLLPGSTFSATPPNFIPDVEIGKNYSLQFKAISGCPADGKFDAPHESQAIVNPAETAGTFDWSGSTIPGAPAISTLGLTFTNGGLLSGTAASITKRSGFRTINLSAKDYQLPTNALPAHAGSGVVQFSIGPDAVVITESTTANNVGAVNVNWSPANTPNNVTYEYQNQTVEMFEPYSSTPTVRPLDDTKDMVASQTNPAGTSLATSLSNIDIMAATVNPTWWAYDPYNLNPLAARGLQHSDLQRLHHSDGYNSDGGAYPYMQIGNSPVDTKERNGDSCIELPKAVGVTHAPASGIYADGGQLRAFDSSSQFGFFIVRKDSKFYVPFAQAIGTYKGFGDAVLTSDRSKSGAFRRPQISVSPDGRFAVAKMKQTIDNFAETSLTQQIVIFSLTGEKPFGGLNYRFLTSGGAGNTTDGQYLYGDTLTLTNTSLYFLKGNRIGTPSDPSVIYNEHFVYKANILSGNPALLQPVVASPNWTNATSGTPASNSLSTPFHLWSSPGATAVLSYSTGGSTWAPSTGTGNQTNGSPTYASPDFFAYQWANFAENSSAPMPFRVSRDGTTCAIIANRNAVAGVVPTVSPFASTTFLRYSIFVDYGTAGMREISSAFLQRYHAGSRTAGLRAGDQRWRLYNWHDGPATQFELSDDGKQVAAVYNSSTQLWNNSGFSNCTFTDGRENLALFRSSGSSTDPWTANTRDDVTLARFSAASTIAWRFGSLAFTRNGGSLVFFGGYSWINPNAYNQNDLWSIQTSGTLYQWTGTTAVLEGILSSSTGGSTDSIASYSTSTPMSIFSSGGVGGQGSIKPVGNFISADGNFYWVETQGSLGIGGDSSSGRLIGVNIKDGTTTINGRSPLRAFAPNWPVDPTPRGFGPQGGFYQYFIPDMYFMCACANSNHRVQSAVSSGNSGVVFFVGYMLYTTSIGTYDSVAYWQGGGPTNPTSWSDAGRSAGEVFGIQTNVGGNAVQLSNLGGSPGAGTYRIIPYLQANETGTKVAYISMDQSDTYGIYYTERERIRTVQGFSFSASTGALVGSPANLAVENTQGRAGTSMTWDFTDSKLYYAFGAGATNENQMVLREAVMNSGGTSVNSYRSFNGVAGTPARFAVLNSGR